MVKALWWNSSCGGCTIVSWWVIWMPCRVIWILCLIGCCPAVLWISTTCLMGNHPTRIIGCVRPLVTSPMSCVCHCVPDLEGMLPHSAQGWKPIVLAWFQNRCKPDGIGLVVASFFTVLDDIRSCFQCMVCFRSSVWSCPGAFWPYIMSELNGYAPVLCHKSSNLAGSRLFWGFPTSPIS